MAWERVGALQDLPNGSVMQFERDGREYLVCRMGDEVFALDNECPHAGGPLAMGNFSPPVLVCPWHAWEFDCRTGECLHSARAAVKRHAVELRAGEIYVNFPEAT